MKTTSHILVLANCCERVKMNGRDLSGFVFQTAEFMDFQSYENYFPTFQLFLLTVVKDFDLLKENGSTENEWNGLVWLPAPVQVQPHGTVAPVPADSVQGQHHGPAAPTAVVRPSVLEDQPDLR